MALRNLIPWSRARTAVPVRHERGFLPPWGAGLERTMRDILPEWGLSPMGEVPGWDERFLPRISVAEDDKRMTVSAELPGMDEKDIEVSISGDTLTLKGEKKDEHEERDGETYRSERWHGQFRRDIPLAGEFDPDKAEASFSKGVLTIELPRKPESQAQRKRIEVKAQ